MTVRVVLGEDSDLMREAIIGILEQIDGVELVAACADATRLRTTTDELLPDVVLTDIRMPPSGTDEGIRVADDLRTSHPGIGVVVLSQHAEPFYVLTLFARGSAGRAYLLKDGLRDRTQLSRAIRAVADGGSVVDARIIEILLASRARRHDAKLSALTSRERDVFALMAEGRSNNAIADALVINQQSVEHDVDALLFKLDLDDGRDVSRRVKAAIMYLHDQAG